MINLVTRFALALVGTGAVVEGYYVYLQKFLPQPAAAEFEARRDPWAGGLENMKRQGNPHFGEERSPATGKSLEEWLQERAGAAGIRSRISSTETEIIVSFDIPGLQSESLTVAVDNVMVLITCIANLVEEKGEPGADFRREALRQYELIMPLPAHADSVRHRVVRGKNAFKIIFTRVEDPSLKS